MSPGLIGLFAAAACASFLGALTSSGRPPAVVGERSRAAVAAPGRPRTGRRAVKDRISSVHAEVPQLLDLLAAGSTAGLSVELSVRRAAASLRGPLGRDLEGVLATVDVGVPWRSALSTFVEASDDDDLKRMVRVIARAETLGVSLRDATSELAATVRDARRAATLERARTAPVKMLFPLVFLILPAFLLLTVVPVLITTVRSIN